MDQLTLKQTTDLSQRIQILTLLREKAEKKVYHADTFRQRNLNFALAIFAGIMAVEIKLGNAVPHIILSVMLSLLMVIFSGWDRRWHKVKHGWDATAQASFQHLVNLIQNPNQDIKFYTYDSTAEKTAEWRSWQPVLFYFLVAASIASFWVLGK